MKLREKIFIWFIALVYLLGQLGCATSRYEYPKPEPLSETYRAQLGSIGVVMAAEVPVIELDRPLPSPQPPQPGILQRTGRGAWEGVKKSTQWYSDLMDSVGTKEEGEVALALFGPFAPLVGLAILAPFIPLAILGGLGGAIGGVFGVAEPPSYVEESRYIEGTEAYLQDTMAKYQIQEKLQSAFLKKARFRTSHTFMVVPEQGPQAFEGLVKQGVDTVLELSVEKIWLKRAEDQEGVMNSPMVLALVVRARLVRGTEKTVWYDHTFVHETERDLYESWLYPIRFQAGLEKAYQKLAEEIVQKLFYQNLTTSPAKIDTSGFVSETHLIAQP
jgi:hypothetical protein